FPFKSNTLREGKLAEAILSAPSFPMWLLSKDREVRERRLADASLPVPLLPMLLNPKLKSVREDMNLALEMNSAPSSPILLFLKFRVVKERKSAEARCFAPSLPMKFPRRVRVERRGKLALEIWVAPS